MSKILYISNHQNLGGWSDAAVRHIQAISNDFEVSSPHVNIGGGLRPSEVTSSNLNDCDICIQQVLPNLAIPDKRFSKNIIVYFSETNGLPKDWVESINRFDVAVVSCEYMKNVAIASEVTIPIKVIPIPLNIKKLTSLSRTDEYKTFLNRHINNDCIFYTIADANPRKDLASLLTAFHCEFHPFENVQLLIKLPFDSNEAEKLIDNLSNEVRKGLRIYSDVLHYKKEFVASGYSSEDQLLNLHLLCDIYVSCSRGEAFSIPSLEAFILKNRCVVPDHSSFRNFFLENSSGAFLFNTISAPCIGAQSPPGLHTAYESWNIASITNLQLAMRSAYKDWLESKATPNRIGNLIKILSINNVRSLWKQLLSS